MAINQAHNERAANEVLRQIRTSGGTAVAVRACVADDAQVVALCARIDAELGRLDALVNSADVVDTTQRLDEQSLVRWRRLFYIPGHGTLLCARAMAAEAALSSI